MEHKILWRQLYASNTEKTPPSCSTEKVAEIHDKPMGDNTDLDTVIRVQWVVALNKEVK